MEVKEEGGMLVITRLPLEDMALLSVAIPLSDALRRVLGALLEGKAVGVTDNALEYKRFRRTAPLAVYQKFVAMERRLREMGVRRAGKGEEQAWS